MKLNKWTVGLAAVGAVSLVSVAHAEEAKMSAVQTALSSTTISGYVDVSANWNLGTGDSHPNYEFSSGKNDGFNLDVIQLSITKPLDESEWAAGYNVDLWFGPDAVGFNDSFNGDTGEVGFAVKQAYINLRMPVGNGIEWKVGVFDGILGYESSEAVKNPNFTRSYGKSIEPTELTGALATYRVNDLISVSAGIADTVDAGINNRAHPPKAESYKTYMGSVTLTAPKDLGFLEGSTLYAGVINGYNSGFQSGNNGVAQTSWYVGGTLATPVAGLRLGGAFDYLNLENSPANPTAGDSWTVAGYATYQATEKLSINGRGEFLRDGGGNLYFPGAEVWAGTVTVQYDLWKNVISRAEFRWDNINAHVFGPGTHMNDYLLAANLIYRF